MYGNKQNFDDIFDYDGPKVQVYVKNGLVASAGQLMGGDRGEITPENIESIKRAGWKELNHG